MSCYSYLVLYLHVYLNVSYLSKSYISQLYDGAHKIKVLHLESNENKNLEKDLNKIEAKFAEEEKKMNSLKNNFQK